LFVLDRKNKFFSHVNTPLVNGLVGKLTILLCYQRHQRVFVFLMVD
jgi:hypothetical protein